MSARLSESAAGIVFLGVDEEGRRASVAVLNRGAAEDAAARDRFRAAINAAVAGPGGRLGGGSGGVAPVVAAQPEGPAPWVATVYEADRVGAERFLEPVAFQGQGSAGWGGRWLGRRRGPQFQPYWSGSVEPALERSVPPSESVVGPVEVAPRRSAVGVVLSLVALLVVVALLMGVLFACQPDVKMPPPPPPEPTPSFPSPSRSPGSPSPLPSPSRPPSTPPPSVPPGDGGPL